MKARRSQLMQNSWFLRPRLQQTQLVKPDLPISQRETAHKCANGTTRATVVTWCGLRCCDWLFPLGSTAGQPHSEAAVQSRKRVHLRVTCTCLQTQAGPLPSCVTLGKSLKPTEPQCPSPCQPPGDAVGTKTENDG